MISFRQILLSAFLCTLFSVSTFAHNPSPDSHEFDETTYKKASMYSVSISAMTFVGGANVSCNGASDGQATATATGGVGPYNYVWFDSSGNFVTGGPTITLQPAGNYSVVAFDTGNGNASTNASVTLTEPTVLSLSPMVVQACGGGATGSLTPNPTGGTPPYGYTWSTGASSTTTSISGLSPGFYSVTVNDANACNANFSINIINASAPSVTVSGSLCAGGGAGTVTANVSGSGPFTYMWSNGATTQTANIFGTGPHSVTVTDNNGCTMTASSGTLATSTLAVTTSHTDADCNGGTNGTATASASGGSAPYTYTWSGGTPAAGMPQQITGLSAGPYTVTVTDADGCQVTATENVGQPSTLTAMPTYGGSTSPMLCQGTVNVVLNASGGILPYIYNWEDTSNPGVSIGTASSMMLGAGSYSYTITDNVGCEYIDNFTFTSFPMMNIDDSFDPACNWGTPGGTGGNATVIVTGGTPFPSGSPYFYNWENTASTGTSVGTGNGIVGVAPSTYSVTITDSNCSVVTTITIPNSMPTATAVKDNDVSCRGGNDGSITITPSGGQMPYSYNYEETSGSMATGSNTTGVFNTLPAGTYDITVTDNYGCSVTATPTGIMIDEPDVALTLDTISTSPSCNGAMDGSIDLLVFGGNTAENVGETLPSTGGYLLDFMRWLEFTATTAFSLNFVDVDPNSTGDIEIELYDPGTAMVIASTIHTVTATGQQQIPVGFVIPAGVTYHLRLGSATTVTGLFRSNAGLTYPYTNPSSWVNITNSSAGTGFYYYFYNWVITEQSYTYEWENTANPGTIIDMMNEDLTGLTAGTYQVTVTDANGCTATATETIVPTIDINPFISFSPRTCNAADNPSPMGDDATVTVIPTGGSSPYDYSWEDSAGNPEGTTLGSTTGFNTVTGLPADTYTVTITDANSCTATASVIVTEPTALDLTTTKIDVTCFGEENGTATATITGGTPALSAPFYTYLWSNGQTTATATGLGTDDEDFEGIFAPANWMLDSNGDNGMVDVTMAPTSISIIGSTSGGGGNIDTEFCIDMPTYCTNGVSGTLSFDWSYTHNGSPGNSTNDPFQYTINGTPTNIVNGPVPPQMGSTSSINLVGGDQFCFVIGSNRNAANAEVTISNLKLTRTYPTSYEVTVMDANGCTITDCVDIDQPTAPLVANFNPFENVSCNGASDGSATAVGLFGTPPYTFQWDAAAGGGTNASVTGLAAGNYSVTITDFLGCTDDLVIPIMEPAVLMVDTLSTVRPSCSGGNDGVINLAVTGGTQNTTADTPVGTLGTLNPSNSYPSVYGNKRWGARHQIIYKATELDAAGIMGPVTLNSIGFNVFVINGATYDNFTIKMGNTATTDFTAPTPWETGLTTVFNPASVTLAATGPITHILDTPFLWDGVSNLVVEVCFNNTSTSMSGLNSQIGLDNTLTFDAVRYYAEDNTSSICAGVENASNPSESGVTNLRPYTTFGISNYTYNWSNGNTNQNPYDLTAGNYTVTVTDANGCTSTTSVMLNGTGAIMPNITTTGDSNCGSSPDGTATAAPTGGLAPYFYMWDMGTGGQTTATATGLATGMYDVTITDSNGCSTVTTANVNPQNPLVVTASPGINYNGGTSQISCNGATDGGVTVGATAGVAPYTFLWSSNTCTTPPCNNQSYFGLPAGVYFVTVTDSNGCTETDLVVLNEPPVLSIASSSFTDESCSGNDGTISISATGGTSPYNYNNGFTSNTTGIFTGLSAGSYSVSVTDVNGCTMVNPTIIINSTTTINLSATGTNVNCNGGSDGTITATASGGSGSFNYAIPGSSNTTGLFTGLAAGTYTVSVTDAGGACPGTVTTTVTLTEPSTTYTAFTSSTTTSCASNTGTATVNVSGGTAGASYTYAWSNGGTTPTITGLATGTYSVVVTEVIGGVNGCTQTATATVTTPSGYTLSTTQTNVDCNGSSTGSAMVTPSGGMMPYTYLWSNGSTVDNITSVGAGTYSVQVTDANGCSVSTSVTITQPSSNVGIVSASVTDVPCGGTNDGAITINAAGGTSPYTYTLGTATNMTGTFSNLVSGSYDYTVTDANGCMDVATSIIGTSTTIALNVTGSNINGCNAMTGTVSAIGNSGTAPYTYELIGGSVINTTGDASGLYTGLSAGLYTVRVTDANSCVATGSTTITLTGTIAVSVMATGLDSNSDTCVDGASTTVTGGVGPYTYTWSNGATTSTVVGLTSGSYAVTVTDANGCIGVTSIFLAPCCVPDYAGGNQLTANQNTNADYETNGVIESDQVIGSAAKVDYDSGTCIELKPGFEVQLGVEFDAFIDGCNGGAGGNQATEETIDNQ